MSKGRISVEYTVWCAKCAQWESLIEASTYRKAQSLARRKGWKKTEKYGWLCPYCVRR